VTVVAGLGTISGGSSGCGDDGGILELEYFVILEFQLDERLREIHLGLDSHIRRQLFDGRRHEYEKLRVDVLPVQGGGCGGRVFSQLLFQKFP